MSFNWAWDTGLLSTSTIPTSRAYFFISLPAWAVTATMCRSLFDLLYSARQLLWFSYIISFKKISRSASWMPFNLGICMSVSTNLNVLEQQVFFILCWKMLKASNPSKHVWHLILKAPSSIICNGIKLNGSSSTRRIVCWLISEHLSIFLFD